MRRLIVILGIFLAGCGPTPTQIQIVEVTKVEPTQVDTQVVVEPTEIELPESTEWVVFVDCPECEGLPLLLWKNVDGSGKSPGKVNHGDLCVVLEVGSYKGVERYKLDCAGMVGWLRAEGVVTR